MLFLSKLELCLAWVYCHQPWLKEDFPFCFSEDGHIGVIWPGKMKSRGLFVECLQTLREINMTAHRKIDVLRKYRTNRVVRQKLPSSVCMCVCVVCVCVWCLTYVNNCACWQGIENSWGMVPLMRGFGYKTLFMTEQYRSHSRVA